MLTKERFDKIKKDGKLMAGNIGPSMYKDLIEFIEAMELELKFAKEITGVYDSDEALNEARTKANFAEDLYSRYFKGF